MTNKADCLPCRIGDGHTFHDDGTTNLDYDYEGAQPPSQESAHSCSIGVDGCDCAEVGHLDDLILAGERATVEGIVGGRSSSYDTWSQEEMETFARALVDGQPGGRRLIEAGSGRRSCEGCGVELAGQWLKPYCIPCGLVQEQDQKPKDLAAQAVDLVYGDRQGAYGHPYDDYSRTAGMWSAFLGVEITPAQAALMMVLLKVSRERNRPKDDNVIDAHGYLLCYGRIQGREEAA